MRSDFGETMADETLGVTVVSDEAILVMADEAVHETTFNYGRRSLRKNSRQFTADVTDVDKASREIVPVVTDEAFAGMADGTCVDTTYEVILVVVNSNIIIIAGSAAEDRS
jgi:hypothetical protein